MKKKLLCILIAALTFTTACGSNKSAGSFSGVNSIAPMAAVTEEAMYDYSSDYGFEKEMSVDTFDGNYSANTETSENASTSNRKLIRDVNLNLETKEYDKCATAIKNAVEAAGGYIEYMDISNNSFFDSYSSRRYASITARIPSDKLDDFLGQLGNMANITNKTESVRDITLTYVDTESHKNMLIAERDHLMELMEQATTVEEIILIEDRLTEVRYQIDSLESQLRTYDNQIDYSTVSINLSEVVSYTPQDENMSVWDRISNGFAESISDVIYETKEFFVNFVISIPYLIVYAVIIAVVFFILRKTLRLSKKYSNWSDRRREERKAKKAAKKTKKNENNNSEDISSDDTTN